MKKFWLPAVAAGIALSFSSSECYAQALSDSVASSVLELPSAPGWWKGFNDPLLDSLINLGEQNNLNLRQSLRKIEVSRQAVRQAKGGYYPQLQLDLGYTRARTSGYTTSMATKAMNTGYFQLGIDMSWEIDIFGRVRSKVKEADANLRVSRAEYEAMCISIAAEIATDYMNLRTLQTELAVTQEHIQQQEKVLKITEARHEAGLASQLDVAQAKTVYYSTLSALSSLETQIATTINAIAVLTGRYPEEMVGLLSPMRPQPNGNWVISTSIPIEWVRNRPDVMEMEYEIESYSAALGVARKEYLPSLSLTAGVGTSAWNIGDMFKKDSYTFSIAPVLEWTIFDGFIREAEIAGARQQLYAAIDNYNETLLTAVQEVDNATFTYVRALKYEKEIEETLRYARQAYELALDRYKQGLDAFINVADSQMTVLEYANELVQARGNVLLAVINIAKAVGRL